MAISEAAFTNEKELDDWVAGNISSFLQNSIYLPGFQITTNSGKTGVPDGFAFNLAENSWYIIEAELIAHGVWSHIAEQIVRFIVAVQNPQTKKRIRDELFNYIIANTKVTEISALMKTTPERLLLQLELFIEGIDPTVALFIDDTNQDLYDMADALSSVVEIYRVRKFIVNGQSEYHSPDKNVPVNIPETPEAAISAIPEYDVITMLGGGEIEVSTGKFKAYRLNDKSLVHIKRSKYHTRHDYYWYGISATTLERIKQHKIDYLVFVMGDDGFAKVPISIVLQFLPKTRTSLNADGSISHYHCLISSGPEPELYYSQEIEKYSLKDYFFPSE